MGKGHSKLPPINERDLRTLMSYNLEERHIKKLFRKFTEMDTDDNGVWTVQELYRVIREPRVSMRAPIIEAIFFMADAKSEGCIDFRDFLVTLASFCALSKEEILHLFFIIVDKDRNGNIEKEELLDFFSYLPIASERERFPVFPVNNKNALDQFRGGTWESLEFDGLAQLCERFPYISYPAFHVQELYRQELLGRSFWSRLDEDRSKHKGMSRKRWVNLPGSREKVEVRLPGRCTMQELLEYSRRKTALHGGRRVSKHTEDDDDDGAQASTSITRERDAQIMACPLLNMIRNSRCMYYVPFQPQEDEGASKTYKSAHAPSRTLRPEMELPELELELELDAEPGGGSRGSILQGPAPWMQQVADAQEEEEDSDSSSGSYESSDEDEAFALQDRAGSHAPALQDAGGGQPRRSQAPALPPGPAMPALRN